MKIMRHKTNLGSSLVAGLALAAALVGCGKSDQGTPTSNSSGPSPARASSAQPVFEKTSFDEVAEQLDPGGRIYGYLSASDWTDGLSKKVGGFSGWVGALPDLSPTDRQSISNGLDFVSHAIGNSGIEDLTGIGVSGIATGTNFYRSKIFLHRRASDITGFAWTITGRTPRKLTELDWLPKDTAWTAFGDLDLVEAWDALSAEVDLSRIKELKEAFKQIETGVKASTGLTSKTLLGSFAGQHGLVVTLDPARTFALPLPDAPAPVDIPEPGLLLFSKVKDDTLFNLISMATKGVPKMEAKEEEGVRSLVFTSPDGTPFPMKPTIARFGDYLFLTTSEAVLKEVISNIKTKKGGFRTTPEFQRLSQGMPTEGNQAMFIGERFGKTFRQMQESVLNSMSETKGASPEAMKFARSMVLGGNAASSYMVGRHLTNGWLLTVQGNVEPTITAAAPLAIGPVAIMAGMTIPALAKAKDRAQSIACVNNLKQLGLGARLWANDHNGLLPRDIKAMKEELSSTRMLVCPSDSLLSPDGAPAWENVDSASVSYDFLAPGASEKARDFANRVVFKCRIHGHICYGDGRVEQATARPRR